MKIESFEDARQFMSTLTGRGHKYEIEQAAPEIFVVRTDGLKVGIGKTPRAAILDACTDMPARFPDVSDMI